LIGAIALLDHSAEPLGQTLNRWKAQPMGEMGNQQLRAPAIQMGLKPLEQPGCIPKAMHTNTKGVVITEGDMEGFGGENMATRSRGGGKLLP
jgi:hypothetical protein